MDIEICSFKALEIAYNEAVYKSDREHVTLFIKNDDRFKKLNYEAIYDFSHLRMTVDEKNDFELIKIILENLYKENKNFSYMDAISFMTKNPYLFTFNATIKRDEGLDKSLINDSGDQILIEQVRFNKWNKLKQQLHNKKEVIKFSKGNIYFMSIGQNIGHESCGKNDLYLRPVLVYKKLSKSTFVGIPLTSSKKEGSYYFSFNYKQGKTSTAMFNQIRVFDIRRAEYLSGHINKNISLNLENKLNEFMKLPQCKNKGEWPTRAKSELIISNNDNNVKEIK
jgi:hypothetical protein